MRKIAESAANYSNFDSNALIKYMNKVILRDKFLESRQHFLACLEAGYIAKIEKNIGACVLAELRAKTAYEEIKLLEKKLKLV